MIISERLRDYNHTIFLKPGRGIIGSRSACARNAAELKDEIEGARRYGAATNYSYRWLVH